MRDLEQAIFNHLTADETTALFGFVGKRIWTPVAPSDWKNNTKAIIVRIDPSKAHGSGATHMVTATFRCYPGQGNKPQDAREVARALFDELQRKGTNGVMTASMTGGGQMPPEPDTGYHSYRQQYEITISNS